MKIHKSVKGMIIQIVADLILVPLGLYYFMNLVGFKVDLFSVYFIVVFFQILSVVFVALMNTLFNRNEDIDDGK